MVRHNDKRMQEKFSLTVIVEDCSLKQFRCSRNLKKATALCRHSCDQIRPGFLGCEPHFEMINEKPEAKAAPIANLRSGA